MLPVFGGWVVLYIIPLGFVINDVIQLWNRRDLRALRQGAVIVKVGGLPYLVLSFLLVATVLLVSAVAFFFSSMCAVCVVIAPVVMIVGSLTVSVLLVVLFLVLLPTSVYGIVCLVLLLRERAIGISFFVVNLILHLILVPDLVSTVLTFRRAGAVLAARRLPLAEAEGRERELYLRHEALEGQAARLAAERSVPEQGTRLKALHERYLRASAAGNSLAAGDLARRFHERVWVHSGHLDLRRELRRVIISFWKRRVPPTAAVDGRLPGCAGDHEVILRAITERRPDEAERAMRDHLARTRLTHTEPLD
ncbi:GntR family transcriptional regulator [Microlunatus speluncae]|uniref:GntR family transcriptional regulator n=1 Tax=Microlunatus speluncae TaxID=2594267 RepID=UPI0012664A5D|nr:FCD domain-containing protein [Microlunatus speluncae]